MTLAGQYIARIRNRAKRAYAMRYLAYLRDDLQGIAVHEPEYPGLSTMAAQAVRMNLIELVRVMRAESESKGQI